MGEKLGTPPPSGGGSWVLIYHKVAWAKASLHTKWHLNPSSHLATTNMGQKLEGCAPLGEGEPGPHLTQCGLGRASSMPSFILIRPTVWPQYTNVTDKTDRQDNGPIA